MNNLIFMPFGLLFNRYWALKGHYDDRYRQSISPCIDVRQSGVKHSG